MLLEEPAPVARRLERLVAAVEVGGLLRPVDGEVDLTDLVEGLGGVLQPGRDLSVLGVGPDDRLDVMIEDREPLCVPVEGEPLMRVARRPTIFLLGPGAKARLDLRQALSVRRHADLAKSRCVRHRIQL